MGDWLRLALVLGVALAACGDDGDGSDAAVDAWVRKDARDIDAHPPGPDAAIPDAGALDAAWPDATPGLLPDLVPEALTRDASYYRVQFCNRGAATAAGMFRVRLTSVATGVVYETPAAYTVPAVDSCVTTGGITCALIGDPDCNLAGTVIAFVDPGGAIVEQDELNNTMGVVF